jgi:hypothetical protein
MADEWAMESRAQNITQATHWLLLVVGLVYWFGVSMLPLAVVWLLPYLIYNMLVAPREARLMLGWFSVAESDFWIGDSVDERRALFKA